MVPAPIYRRGDRGPAVADVRDRLIGTGDLPRPGDDPAPASSGTPDGSSADVEFDAALERAVRAFQQRRGLLVDGRVGPQTYRALDAARWRLGDRILSHTPGHLLAGDDVAELQQRLLRLGFDAGRVDGVLGPDTDAALRDLQRGVGLPADGLCGPRTLRALGRIQRSVGGGRPQMLRETGRVRDAGAALTGRTVVIDPGHGGADPGASAHGLTEAEVVLDLARRIEGRLAAVGVRTALTRGAANDPDDADRAELANTLRADLVVSLHCEGVDSAEATGVATFFYGADRDGAWSPVGETLADLVQREVVARTDLRDCRTHARTWDLLRRTRMPAVRVEAGHLTHPGDAARLADPAFRDVLAEAVVVAIQRLYLVEEDEATTTGTLNVRDVLARAGRV